MIILLYDYDKECRHCNKYWSDLKYCTERKIFAFVPEFKDISKKKCFKQIKKKDDELEFRVSCV